jgi:hypothetical protein
MNKPVRKKKKPSRRQWHPNDMTMGLFEEVVELPEWLIGG